MNPDGPDWSGLAWVLKTDGTCPCCGMPSYDVFSKIYDRMFSESVIGPILPNAELNASQGDIQTEDFCRFGDDRFVRALLTLSIQGAAEPMRLILWASLSIPSFERYILWLGEGGETPDRMPRWLMTRTPFSADIELFWLVPRPGRRWSDLVAQPAPPFDKLQKNGLAPIDVKIFLEDTGHDIRRRR